MFDQIDRAYFERRAIEEHERARAATDPCAAIAHRKAALKYEYKARTTDGLHGERPRPAMTEERPR